MSKLKILVADDDPVTRTLLGKKLTQKGYWIQTAENGQAAIGAIEDGFFDVVLTDLVMPPGPDGVAVLEAAKKKNTLTEVILVTAHGSIDNAVDAMRKGASDYLQKPINFDELFLRLEKIGHIRDLAKDAGDLREAMCVTEEEAGKTIMELELALAELKEKVEEAKQALASDMEFEDRVAEALDILS